MRWRRWIEFLKDYEFTLKYHPGKANMVANALNRKSLYVASIMLKEYELIEQMRDLNLTLVKRPGSLKMSDVRIQRDLKGRIKTSQDFDVFVKEIRDQIRQGKTQDFNISKEGFLKFWDMMYLPLEFGIKGEILEKAYKIKYTIHSGTTKMY